VATGVEINFAVQIYWSAGDVVYNDKAAGSAEGRLLEVSNVNMSANSRTVSFTLDDTDGTLRGLLDTEIVEGTVCKVAVVITGGSTYVLFNGQLSSDVIWSEGERHLTLNAESVDESNQSSEIGYTPIEGAFAALKEEAYGKPWPVVVGVCDRVPAVRVEFQEDYTLNTMPYINYDTSTYHIEDLENGDGISIFIDRIKFIGDQVDGTFTPTTKNAVIDTNIDLTDRVVGDDDEYNDCVVWLTDSSVSLLNKFCIMNDPNGVQVVNRCTGQYGAKCKFSQPWGWLPDTTDFIIETAGFPKSSWTAEYEIYDDSDNMLFRLPQDGWQIQGGSPVYYDSGEDYDDKYICNLIESDNILAVWGKRKYFGKDIWSQIPSSYYTVNLDDSITTDPGSVSRTVTSIEFSESLKKKYCENWEEDIWVSVDSIIPGTTSAAIEWIVSNYTSLSMDADSATVTRPCNFMFTGNMDAIALIRGIAEQSACELVITNDQEVKLIDLTENITLSPDHTVDEDDIIFKSLELGLQETEDYNTVLEAKYVLRYDGRPSSEKVYAVSSQVSQYGVKKRSWDLDYITCTSFAEAIVDFWHNRFTKSWKTVSFQTFTDALSWEIGDSIHIDLSAGILDSAHGRITAMTFNPETALMSVKVDLAQPSGSNSDDSTWWTLGAYSCDALADIETDFEVPIDDSCANWIVFSSAPVATYFVRWIKLPSKAYRWSTVKIQAEIVDKQGNRIPEAFVDLELRAVPSNDRDNFWKTTAQFINGFYEDNANFRFRGGLTPCTIMFVFKSNDKRIKTGVAKTTQIARGW